MKIEDEKLFKGYSNLGSFLLFLSIQNYIVIQNKIHIYILKVESIIYNHFKHKNISSVLDNKLKGYRELLSWYVECEDFSQ